ncbi:MAG: DUF4337 domain-containing protein [Desulfobacteraceae bacterium]|nr:DUF4337 domain-containing protein [Desulfobacteraceae bacterium]
MAEEKKEPWLNYLALSTVILAVCATLSTFKGGSYSTLSVLSQTKAANQWSYYQAKSIKGYIYEIEKESLELDLKEREPSISQTAAQNLKERVDSYGKKIARYETEKSDIQKEAKKFEAIRDDAQEHSKIFGLAVIFLQIAILLSSVAALMKKKPVWYLGLILGAVGIFFFFDGFFLFL